MNPNNSPHHAPSADHSLIDLYYEARDHLNTREPADEVCPSFMSLTRVDERYTQKELLARGGVKEIYKVYDENSRRFIAMAMLREDLEVEFFDPFIHEAWLTALLSHPNIIKVHDIGIIDTKRPFFTMDLKKGNTLTELVRKKNRTLEYLLNVFMKICDAVAYAHSQHVLHLDLKPSNIQVESFGEVLVCDWGLGYLQHSDRQHPLGLDPDVINHITLWQSLRGTPGFMAPEQILTPGNPSARTDIFSLGCILYFILTGTEPFRGSETEILEQTRITHITPPRKRAPQEKIPTSLSAIVMKAMAHLPTDRYASVKELQHDISRYLEKRAPAAENAGLAKRAILFYARNSIRCLIAAASILLLTLFGIMTSRIHGLYLREKMHAQHSEEDYLASTIELVDRSLKDKFYQNPYRGLFYANRALDKALEKMPDNKDLIWRKVSCLIIALEFEEVRDLLNDKLDQHAYWSPYLEKLTGIHPESRLPTPNQMREIIDTMRSIDHERIELVTQMIAYDARRRKSRENYAQVIESGLLYLNPSWSDRVFEYQLDSETLTLGGQNLHHLKSIKWLNHTLLNHLPIKTLNLQIHADFDVQPLQALPIETLDISDSASLDLSALAEFPQLKTLVLKQEQNQFSIPPHLTVRYAGRL